MKIITAKSPADNQRVVVTTPLNSTVQNTIHKASSLVPGDYSMVYAEMAHAAGGPANRGCNADGGVGLPNDGPFRFSVLDQTELN